MGIIILIVVCGGLFWYFNQGSLDSAKEQEHNTGIPMSSKVPSGATAVDLGLSVKWANMNIGATCITDYGNYYAWGETIPQSNNHYDWQSYKWADGDSASIAKYCTNKNFGTIDSRTTLEAEDDAATVNWGDNWRMPTKEECQELSRDCYWVMVSNYNNSGVSGYIVYKAKNNADKGIKVKRGEKPSSKYSLSDNHIFLPAAGTYNKSFLNNLGTFGHYRSRSLNESFCNAAFDFFFMPSGVLGQSIINNRHIGKSIRAVCP